MAEDILNLAERIEELESRLAFQEDTIAQLNDVIARQDTDIRSLVARVRELGEKYGALSFDELQSSAKQADEKPPHY